MKLILKFTLLICTIFVHCEALSQKLEYLKLDTQQFKFDPEPFKPRFLPLNVYTYKPHGFTDVNGNIVSYEETKEEYDKRNAIYKEKQFDDFINSEIYKKWYAEHLKWRKRNPTWKKITIYPELINQNVKQESNSSPPKIGEFYLVTAKTLNIRSEANNKASIIASLNLGAQVKLINADHKTWWLIRDGINEGYVFSQFLKLDPNGGWDKTNYKSGETPECENVDPQYDYKIDNYLRINVGSGTDVVVKLMKIGFNGDECIRIVYVRSNDNYEIINIPQGKYYLKIAYGKDYRQKIINTKCFVKFLNNAEYEKGAEILDFNLVKQPNKKIGDNEYESWDIPSFVLSLDVIESKGITKSFKSNLISEEEFNK